MRTTITIEDDLFEKASGVAGINNASELVKIAFDKLVAAESRKRLIALGGSAPGFSVPGRGLAEHEDETLKSVPSGMLMDDPPEN